MDSVRRPIQLKLVVIGDLSVGKTSFCKVNKTQSDSSSLQKKLKPLKKFVLKIFRSLELKLTFKKKAIHFKKSRIFY
jgi:hypothetical protein